MEENKNYLRFKWNKLIKLLRKIFKAYNYDEKFVSHKLVPIEEMTDEYDEFLIIGDDVINVTADTDTLIMNEALAWLMKNHVADYFGIEFSKKQLNSMQRHYKKSL